MRTISIKLSSIPYTLLFTISGYVFIGSFLSALILFLIFLDDQTNQFPWYLGFAFHISLEILFLGFAQKDAQWSKNTHSMRDSKTIIEDTKTLAIIIGMAGIVNFLGMFDTMFNIQYNVFSLAVSILYAGYMGIVMGMGSSFVFRLMYQRPHAKSSKYTIWIIGLSILIAILQLFLHEQLQIGIHIIAGILGIIGFYNTKGLQWFSGIKKQEKTDLAWSSLSIVIAISIIAGNYAQTTLFAMNQIFLLAEPFLLTIGIWLFLISGRLATIALNSLPTAGLIDRKSIEFSALAELTTIAATSQSYQQILENTMHLIEKAIAVKGIYFNLKVGKMSYEQFHGELSKDLSFLMRNPEFKSWKMNQPGIGNLCEVSELIDSYNSLKIMSVLFIQIAIDQSKDVEITLVYDKPYHFTPEDEIILTTFGDSFRIAIINTSLLELQLEHQKLEQEIEIARDVQVSLLPKTIYMPRDYDIAAYAVPARIVGGDFYDVFNMKNGNTCIIIGDVSGKGIPAAFWMATIRGVLLSLQYASYSAKEILLHLQHALSPILDPHVFITASCLILERETSRIQYARAGHMPLLRADLKGISICQPRGMGIGLTLDNVMFENILEEVTLHLNSDEIIILSTDGLDEFYKMNNVEDEYASLHDMIIAAALYPQKLINTLSNEIQNTVQDSLIDDITIIALKHVDLIQEK